MGFPNPDRAKAPIVGLSERYDTGQVASHSHRRAQLIFAVSGALTIETNAGLWVLPTHRALWIPGGIKHAVTMRKSTELRTLYFDEKTSGVTKRKNPGVVEVSDLLRHLILEAVKKPWSYTKNSTESRLFRVLCDQLEVLSDAPLHLPEPSHPAAKRLSKIYREDSQDRRPLATVALQVGASLRSLERIFKAETGLSLGIWVQQLRLITALQNLADGMTVGDAAFSVGFQNPSSFIALFKSQFGTTPKSYFAKRGANQILD